MTRFISHYYTLDIIFTTILEKTWETWFTILSNWRRYKTEHEHEMYFPWSKEFFLDERSVRLLPAIKQSIRPDKLDIMICFNVFAGGQPSQELTPTSRWSQGQCYDDCGGSSWAEYPLSWPRILPVEVRTVATPDLNNNAVITVLVSHNIDQNYF